MNNFPSEIRAYTPICLCGSGAYGSVWLVTDAVGVRCALKIVFKNSLGGDWQREFSGLEYYRNKVSEHPNLIRIHHIEDCGTFFYYTMDCADNLSQDANQYYPATLANKIRKNGALPPAELIELFDRLLDALAQLHESGVIHRDIKPDNIIFVNGSPKIGDIGLVSSVSHTLSLAGTQDFIPPEYLTGQEKEVRPSIDIYALGKTLYCAFSGQEPTQFPMVPSGLLKTPILRHLNWLVKYVANPNPRIRVPSLALFRDLLHQRFGLQYKLKLALHFIGRIFINRYFVLLLIALSIAGLLYAIYGPIVNTFTPKTTQEHMTWTPQDEKRFTQLRKKPQRSYDEEVELRMKMEKLSNIADAKGKSRYELTEAGRIARMHRKVYTEDFSFAGWHFLSTQEPLDASRYIFRGRNVDMLLEQALPEEFDLKFTLELPKECMKFTIQLMAEDSIIYDNVATLRKPLSENHPCFFEFSILADGKFSNLRNKNPLDNTDVQTSPQLQNTYMGENYFQIVKTGNQIRIFVNELQAYDIFIFPWSNIRLRFFSTPESPHGEVDLTALEIYNIAQTTGRGQFRLPLPNLPSFIPMSPNQQKRPSTNR